MHAATLTVSAPTLSPSKAALWTGRGVAAFVSLFLVFDGVIHISKIPMVVEAFQRLGYSSDVAVGLGILELLCVLLYVIRRTSILGAILLTGYLGGAVATHVRVGSSLFGEILFPVYVGVLMWGALYLMDRRLRALVSLRG